jgi:hypothetical protein
MMTYVFCFLISIIHSSERFLIMGKGSGFEREMCKKFSLWWTNGTRDDIFWRTAGSGARATTRFRKSGKSTYANSGDLLAVDPIGKPFTDIFTVEMKRGYKSWSIMDQIDCSKKATEQTISLFLKQALMGANRPDCYNYPMLITRRDKRTEMVTIPMQAVIHLLPYNIMAATDWLGFFPTDPALQFTNPDLTKGIVLGWASFKLEFFLENVTPAKLMEFYPDFKGMKAEHDLKFQAEIQRKHDEDMKAILNIKPENPKQLKV